MRIKIKIICCVLAVTLLTGCFSYKDMNRLLFLTVGAIDYKDENIFYFGEAFKGYRGEGDKVGQEKRVLIFGQGKTLTDAGEDLWSTVNYLIQYDGSKALVFSKALAEHGLEDVLDVVNRDQKPSMRQYLFVYDGDVCEMMSIVMEDEQFTGLYLYELMNSQRDTSNVISSQYYQFLRNMDIGSGINVVPILKTSTIKKDMEVKRDDSVERMLSGQSETEDDSSSQDEKATNSESAAENKDAESSQGGEQPFSDAEKKSGKVDEGNESPGGAANQAQKGEGESPERGKLEQSSGQNASSGSGQDGSSGEGGGDTRKEGETEQTPLDYKFIMVSGAAVIVKDKMAASLDESELRTYNLLKDHIKIGYLHCKNPQYPDKAIGFIIESHRVNHTVSMEDDRIKVKYNIKLKVVLQDVNPGISADDDAVLSQLKTTLQDQVKEDIIKLYDKMKSQDIDIWDIKHDLEIRSMEAEDDFLDRVDFEPVVDITLQGLGQLREAYY